MDRYDKLVLEAAQKLVNNPKPKNHPEWQADFAALTEVVRERSIGNARKAELSS